MRLDELIVSRVRKTFRMWETNMFVSRLWEVREARMSVYNKVVVNVTIYRRS